MPEEGIEKQPHAGILSYEEMAHIVRAAAELGVGKVRLTGGEPLARLGLVEFVRMLSAIPGIDDLALTTNGTLLARYAADLAAAGLNRVNISLDTLQADRFQAITRRNRFADVWDGVAAARAAGLTPIKFNMVVVRGLNDDEVVAFARRTLEAGWHVRYIELMPIGANVDWAGEGRIPIPDIRDAIERELGPLAPVHGPTGNGPARYYQLIGGEGTIGFIGAVSDHFCQACNRLRLTADGTLRPCLLSDREIDLKPALRAGAGLEEIKGMLAQAIRAKPPSHHLDRAQSPRDRAMAQIGG
jgi:cyclic pyranopterin phosphate synthase